MLNQYLLLVSSCVNGIYCLQEKQAENKKLQRRVESVEKSMKDMKTKLEYVLHVHIDVEL